MAQTVLPYVIRQGGGRVVAIASEMARHRINVNWVCPGPSERPLFPSELTTGRPGLGEAL